MLEDFLSTHREEIIIRARQKTAEKFGAHATADEVDNGIPMFLTQLVEALQSRLPAGNEVAIGDSATRHGGYMRRSGFTVGQVVQDYGGLCQAITELAIERDAAISTDDFKTLNCCLDGAVASAVTEFGQQRERSVSDAGNEELGQLAHELRNALHVATLGFDALQSGIVGPNGSTSTVIVQSLSRMRDLLDRSLTEVRLKAGLHRPTSVSVAALVEQVGIAAAIDATHRGLHLTIGKVADDVTIYADMEILVSALSNLLQNAFKFTHPHGRVSLSIRTTDERVRIDVEDQCGGLPPGTVEVLFRMFEQRSADRSGLGLGLAISRRGIEDSGGTIRVQDRPGQGCVFTVELPRTPRGAVSDLSIGNDQSIGSVSTMSPT